MSFITTEDATLIVEAINNLKQGPDYFKDYVLPVITLMLSACLAYFIARRTNDRAESIKVEIRKASVINNYLLKADICIQSLICIKSFYHGKLNDNSFHRLAAMPPIEGEFDLKNLPDITELVFMTPDEHENSSRWNQVTGINLIFDNYKALINMVKTQQTLKSNLHQCISDLGTSDISLDIVLNELGKAQTIKLMQVTEQIIILVDDLLLFFNDFSQQFPLLAKKRLRKDMPKGIYTIINFCSEENHIKRSKYFDRSPILNTKTFCELSGLSHEEALQIFSPTYTDNLEPKINE
jgi:hypothetical protein